MKLFNIAFIRIALRSICLVLTVGAALAVVTTVTVSAQTQPAPKAAPKVFKPAGKSIPGAATNPQIRIPVTPSGIVQKKVVQPPNNPPPPPIQSVTVTNSPIGPPRDGSFAPGETVQFTVELASKPSWRAIVKLEAHTDAGSITLQGMPASVTVPTSSTFTTFSAVAPNPGGTAIVHYVVKGYYLSPDETIPQVGIFRVNPTFQPGNFVNYCPATPTPSLHISPGIVHQGDTVSFNVSLGCTASQPLSVRVRRINTEMPPVVAPPHAIADAEGSRNGLMTIPSGSSGKTESTIASTPPQPTMVNFTAQILNAYGVPTGPVSNTASVNVLP